MDRAIQVLHMLPDLRIGGGQSLLLSHVRDLPSSHYVHHVCSVQPQLDMARAFRDAGARVHCLNVARRRHFPGGLARLLRLIRATGVDLIHTNSTRPDRRLGELAGMLCRRPVVNTLHGGTGHEPRRLRALIKRRYDRLMSRSIRHIVAVSDSVRDAYLPSLRAAGISDHVTVIRPGIDMRRFPATFPTSRTAALRRELNLEGAGPVLITVARFQDGKGLSHLTQVMAEVSRRWPGATLLLVGDGPLRERIERQFTERGLRGRVCFTGDRHDVPELLMLADLLVFPSLREGFGLVVLEAMAAGRPVAAYALPAYREFAEDAATGVFTPVGDKHTLACRVVELLEQPRLMRTMGERAREVVATRFTQAESTAALDRVYRDLLDDHPHKRLNHHKRSTAAVAR